MITGFGRLGTPFAADYFGVVPDMMTVAKGLTNASVPMGAVFVRRGIYETVVDSAPPGIELFHGYTYSGHPLAAAAGLATLELYETEGLFERAASLAPYWEQALHSLRGAAARRRHPQPRTGRRNRARATRRRARCARLRVFVDCFNRGVLMRVTGDIIALSPPLIIEERQIDELVGTVGDAIRAVKLSVLAVPEARSNDA